MKTMSLVAAVFLLVGVCAPQESSRSEIHTDGNSILESCAATEKSQNDPMFFEALVCQAYINAALDARYLPNVPISFCFPGHDLPGPQIYAVVLKYLRNHPELLHTNGVILIHMALADAFPCGRQ